MESDSRESERECNIRGAGERERERRVLAASSSSRPCAGFMSSKIRDRFFGCEGEIWVRKRNGEREVRKDGGVESRRERAAES